MYSVSDIASAVGGALGLWIGVSAITGMEVMTLFYKLCFNIVGHSQRLPNNTKI